MDDRYDDIRYELRGAVAWITIDRESAANTFRRQTTLEMLDALRDARGDREVRAVVLTGAGDRFFCIGGEKEEIESLDYSSVLPIIDVYETIDAMPKPVVAAVNGYAVGGGNVLHTVCDLSIASDRAMFRQVGPMVGSYDAGYGSWYLEATIGRKRAKEMWYLNRKYTAEEAREMGLVNDVVPHEDLTQHVDEVCEALMARGPQAIAGLKAAFYGQHHGVAGQARMGHDLLLTHYRLTEEAQELATSFAEKRDPDQGRFNH